MTQRVRLYGRLNGYGSQAQVTRGFLRALKEAGALAGVVALDRDEPPDTQPPGGSTAEHAVFTGLHAMMPEMHKRGRHQQRWVMLAPNSDRVPVRLMQAIEAEATDVMVPSAWAEQVVGDMTKLPVHRVPHGVAPEYHPHPGLSGLLDSAYRDGKFLVLHFSTSDRERKGTAQLVEAWERLRDEGRIPEEALLALVLDLEAAGRYYDWISTRERAPEQVIVRARLDASPTEMAYALGAAHVVCQPSRGEGFGMVPLEARACGTPVVATDCTGHSEHLCPDTPGAVIVESGNPAPIDDMPGALAPSVTVEAVMVALERAYQDWPRLQAEAMAEADGVRERWSWGRQLAAWIEKL